MVKKGGWVVVYSEADLDFGEGGGKQNWASEGEVISVNT